MKTKVYLGIALRIIFLFSVAMAATYLPDQLRSFFGDVPYVPGRYNDMFDDKYDWGARHHWYAWMMFFLFVLSLINLVMHIVNLIEKEYGNIKL
ncbi:MAG TPA: hypothetical protein VI757_11765 [Bacteroidia bacterium]|nr:hypothetical protein [Bacteroidia bacterium]